MLPAVLGVEAPSVRMENHIFNTSLRQRAAPELHGQVFDADGKRKKIIISCHKCSYVTSQLLEKNEG